MAERILMINNVLKWLDQMYYYHSNPVWRLCSAVSIQCYRGQNSNLLHLFPSPQCTVEWDERGSESIGHRWQLISQQIRAALMNSFPWDQAEVDQIHEPGFFFYISYFLLLFSEQSIYKGVWFFAMMLRLELSQMRASRALKPKPIPLCPCRHCPSERCWKHPSV